MKNVVIVFLQSMLLMTACVSQTQPEFSEPVLEDGSQVYLRATQTNVVIETTQPKPKLTATADTRPLPEDWQTWPVVPEVTAAAREIYRQGIAMDNDPHAFSKVGDCQNVKQSFLGFFDHPDQYAFMSGITEMQDTIDHFKGHFDRDGEATKYGFNAAAVLSPFWTDPDVCLPDETPLECELRITRPTFVLISLEFWFEGRTSDVYERYMRQIIEYTISQGAVPILATKADNIELDHSLNLTTAKLAYEYDLPLWNWWAAAQELSDAGMDKYRNDGFHISVDAWNVRSKTFLQTLDHLWKELRDTV
jgi:hypothetical protein